MGKGKRVYLRDGLVNSWKTLVYTMSSRAFAGANWLPTNSFAGNVETTQASGGYRESAVYL